MKQAASRISTDGEITAIQAARFRKAVESMDYVSQSGFSEIRAIAKLVLSRLEQPDAYKSLDEIADVLNTIWEKSESCENTINSLAEGVGCNHVDEARRRRWAARSA